MKIDFLNDFNKVYSIASKEIRGYIFFIISSSIIINICGVLMPLFSMLIYDKVVKNGNIETLWSLTIGMLIFIFLEFTLRMLRHCLTESIISASELYKEFDFMESIFNTRLTMSSSIEKIPSHYKESLNIKENIVLNYSSLLSDLPFFVIFLLFLLLVDSTLCLVFFTSACFMIFGQWIVGFSLRKYNYDHQNNASNKFIFLSNIIYGIHFFQTSFLQDKILKKWNELSIVNLKTRNKFRFFNALSLSWTSFCISVSSIILLVVGVYQISSNSISMGVLIACSLVNIRAMSLLSSLVNIINALISLNKKETDVKTIIVNDNSNLIDELVLPIIDAGDINILDLSITSEKTLCLKNISLFIKKGEKIAIIGRPGSGKSTLLQCIGGVIEPTHGQVLMSGVNVNIMSAKLKMKYFAYKHQDAILIDGILQDNFPIVSDLFPKERIVASMNLCGLDAMLKSGELTRDKLVNCYGRNLSNGQRQIISLSSILAHDAAIYLLDEPTVGIDAELERQLINAINSLTMNKTVIISTHSMAVLEHVDKIIVLDQGNIILNGGKDEILKILLKK